MTNTFTFIGKKESKSDLERHISHDIPFMWNLKNKNNTNELIYKTELDPQTYKTNLLLPKGITK